MAKIDTDVFRKCCVAVVCPLIAAFATGGSRADEPPAQAADAPVDHTKWLHDAKWGVMFHFVSAFHGQLNSPEKWERAINDFDVRGLCDQLEEAGVGYFAITSRHVGFPLAPHSRYENGEVPSRDLIAELAQELKRRDIHLMLYFACGGKPGATESAKIIAELSQRYGADVKG